MVLVHDDDLVHISGLGDGKVNGHLDTSSVCRHVLSQEFLKPDVLGDYLNIYPLEIQQIMCGESLGAPQRP